MRSSPYDRRTGRDPRAVRTTRVSRTTALGATVAALCLTLLPAAPAGAAGEPSASGDGPLAAFHEQRLDWKSCSRGPGDEDGEALERAGARCADVRVPLDYRKPDGRTITVAISRIAATDRDRRVGPLLLNGGGPGGPSLVDAVDVRRAMRGVAARYDVIGVDPRFVGRSTPLDCGWPTGQVFRAPGADRAGFDRTTAFARDLAERCAERAGDLLPHVNTRNTARDMDVIRAALGERRISYLGYSYGSYLGQVYVSMFPRRADRVVLDGVVDPAAYGPRLLSSSLAENRAALEEWAVWAAGRHDVHGLGATPRAVVETVEGLQRTAARKPLTVGGYTVDEHLVPLLVFMGLGQDNEGAREAFAHTVRDLRRAAAGEAVRPSPALAAQLRFLLTADDSHYGSAQTAILCGDRAAPRDPERYWRDVRRAAKRDPLLGPFSVNINPCAFWRTPDEAPTRIRDDFPALLVNSTGDPRTTHANARTVRAQWPGSRLVTLSGSTQHAVYAFFGSACVDRRVNDYLATGELPATDRVCRAAPARDGVTGAGTPGRTG
ncbi:alpha/beta fold hydrolase [Streptomyces sp. JNUCC 64]